MHGDSGVLICLNVSGALSGKTIPLMETGRLSVLLSFLPICVSPVFLPIMLRLVSY